MTSVYELTKLVRQGEGIHLEFKLKANHPDKITRSIAAFANTKGGWLLIGVDDNRGIKGCKSIEEEEFVMEKAIKQFLHPIPSYSLEKINLQDERGVLAFYIQESEQKPIYWNDPSLIDLKSPKGKVYVRVADQSLQASYEMRQIIKGLGKSFPRKLQYGDKERTLMKFLDVNPYVTIDRFAEVAGITKKTASATLVFLCLMKVIEIVPGELEDRYILSSLTEPLS